jgi:hypothetical protein
MLRKGFTGWTWIVSGSNSTEPKDFHAKEGIHREENMMDEVLLKRVTVDLEIFGRSNL